MARGVQLLQLVDQLRSKLRESKNPSHGLNTRDTYVQELNDQQAFLYHDFAWSYLNGQFDVDTEAGERYYDWPVEYGSIKRIEYKWGTAWSPVTIGIAGNQLNAQDSDLDQRTDPIQRIAVKDGDQFEVWPIPATDGNPIRFYGRQALTRMVNDDDRCVIDDGLIVRFAAASLAPKDRYQRLLAEANSYYSAQKKRYGNKSRGFVLGGGGGTPQGRQPPGHVRVAEADRSGS